MTMPTERELVRVVQTKTATPVRKERSDSSKSLVVIPDGTKI